MTKFEKDVANAFSRMSEAIATLRSSIEKQEEMMKKLEQEQKRIWDEFVRLWCEFKGEVYVSLTEESQKTEIAVDKIPI